MFIFDCVDTYSVSLFLFLFLFRHRLFTYAIESAWVVSVFYLFFTRSFRNENNKKKYLPRENNVIDKLFFLFCFVFHSDSQSNVIPRLEWIFPNIIVPFHTRRLFFNWKQWSLFYICNMFKITIGKRNSDGIGKWPWILPLLTKRVNAFSIIEQNVMKSDWKQNHWKKKI